VLQGISLVALRDLDDVDLADPVWATYSALRLIIERTIWPRLPGRGFIQHVPQHRRRFQISGAMSGSDCCLEAGSARIGSPHGRAGTPRA